MRKTLLPSSRFDGNIFFGPDEYYSYLGLCHGYDFLSSSEEAELFSESLRNEFSRECYLNGYALGSEIRITSWDSVE